MLQCRHPLGMPIGQCQAGADQQAVAVLHQPVSHEAQFRLLAFPLADQARQAAAQGMLRRADLHREGRKSRLDRHLNWTASTYLSVGKERIAARVAR